MEQDPAHFKPSRITDLITFKKGGASVSCEVSFEILPVEFAHRKNPFQAHIFLCRYECSCDGIDFSFRKCYARGCSHNLCPHVSQAVMTANRYLQRDYHKLEQVGIKMEKRLFTLEEMMVKFDGYQEEHGPILTIHDYINIAKEGNEVAVEMDLEYVPGVEHFANYENQMIFMMVDFAVSCLGKTHHYERCLACYQMDREKEEKQQSIKTSNERLKLLYGEFDQAAVKHEKVFFD